MSAHPSGWKRVTLGDLLDIRYGKALTASQRRAGAVIVYGSSGIAGDHDEHLHDGPALVIGRKGAAGKVHLHEGGPLWAIDTAYYAPIPDGVNASFLARQLAHLKLRQLDQSTAVPSLNRDELRQVEIALPPEEEQVRIEAVLDDVLGLARYGASCLEAALADCEKLRAATLNGLGETGAPMVALRDVAAISTGQTPKRAVDEYWNGDIPWVSSGEVAFNRIASTREHITDAGLGNAERRLHPPGTVLMAMYGDGKTRGQVAVLDIPAATNQAVAAMRPDPTKILTDFLYLWLVRQYLVIRQSGHGGQQRNLSKRLVEQIDVPSPSLAAQRSIVSRVVKTLDGIDRYRQTLLDQLRSADAMERSILHQAFTGQLSTRDRVAVTA